MVESTIRRPFTAGTKVEFITDLEGNWDYFLSLVEASPVLEIRGGGAGDAGPLGLALSLAPNSILVHGGDSPDKGPGDIRIVKALVSLKKKYPDRVFLICGNRDVNKLRFTSELAEGETEKATDVYWDANHKPYKEYLAEKELPASSPISKLKWMLECTMGCPTTFETRRAELALLRRVQQNTISDEQVVQSFKDSVDPSGEDPWMLEYMKYGQLALILGDCLFVHGGVHKLCLGKVPNRGDVLDGDIETWCAALNLFMNDMIQEFEKQPTWDAARTKRGAEALLDYGVPGGFGDATVTYYSHTVGGNCVAPDTDTQDYLARSGIKRLFVGHTPSGECPSVVATRRGLDIFMCDTSYSDIMADKSTNLANNRGIAFSNVVITANETIVKGRLSNGETHGYCLKLNRRESKPDGIVGRQLDDGSWVKTIVGGKLQVAKGEGRVITTRLIELEEVVARLRANV